MELSLSPPVDSLGIPDTRNWQECAINFRVTLRGRWAIQLWVENGDYVRVIGSFCGANKFHLLIDDNFVTDPNVLAKKASLIVVEPHILIPTTNIVEAPECTRKAYLTSQFSRTGDINYALVLGNVIHEVFQAMLEQMNFQATTLTKIIKESIKPQLLLLYSLGKVEAEVEADARRAICNIQQWLDMVFFPHKNEYKIKYDHFVAAEQEFNTFKYGIKGKIDGTLLFRDP